MPWARRASRGKGGHPRMQPSRSGTVGEREASLRRGRKSGFEVSTIAHRRKFSLFLLLLLPPPLSPFLRTYRRRARISTPRVTRGQPSQGQVAVTLRTGDIYPAVFTGVASEPVSLRFCVASVIHLTVAGAVVGAGRGKTRKRNPSCASRAMACYYAPRRRGGPLPVSGSSCCRAEGVDAGSSSLDLPSGKQPRAASYSDSGLSAYLPICLPINPFGRRRCCPHPAGAEVWAEV
ncbi:hypothetical protein F4802DRAFT_421012 [Xylaria palmicola]|nr:hypothetical protein F4802DRAFT_421012 [Xylaria palmicola]